MEPPDDDIGEHEIRPLPDPPHCRGIQVDEDIYTGCAYGYSDVEPFVDPCDCPTCNGSGLESPVGTTLPHSEFGDPDCCGYLNGIVNGKLAQIECNECGAIVRTVPTIELEKTLDEMELQLDVATEKCPHCGAVNLIPGFSRVLVFTCRKCGKAVNR